MHKYTSSSLSFAARATIHAVRMRAEKREKEAAPPEEQVKKCEDHSVLKVGAHDTSRKAIF